MSRHDVNQQYRLLFETMHFGFALHEIVCDAEGRPQDYRFLEVNRAFEELTGLRREDVIGRTAKEVLPGLESSWIERYGKVALTGLSDRFESYSAALGRFYEVTAYCPERGRFVTVFSDVTPRKEAERALRASEERYRLVVEHSPDGIAVYVDGEIVFANAAAAAILGYETPLELLGRRALDLVHPDWREVVMARMRRMAETGEPAPLLEEKLLRADGLAVEVEVQAVPFVYEGRPAVQVIVRDISARKEAERALRASEEQLRQSQKLEAVGRLAGGIAHDFNNLLTAVGGHAALMLADERLDPGLHPEVEEILAGVNRATTLTRQILAFSRRQPLRLRVFDLNEALSAMEGLLRRTLGEDVSLVIRYGTGLWPVEADPGQVEQIILNLAVNARDAMPNGGALTLETANVQLDEAYTGTHLEARPGPYVMLAVTDTGMGMTPEVRARAFEPFFTTKEEGKGTGLGLSTVYGIVKQSGGSIWVYSEPGRGTTFKIYLPRVEKGIDWCPARLEPTLAPARGGSEAILLVEDEPTVRTLVERVLAAQGYAVIAAASPAEALEILAAEPGPLDLLLTDVVLPGMSGWQFAQLLLERYPGLKVLYTSGYTENAIVHDGFLDLGIEFLEKPFTPDVLARRVREVLDA
ncbi:MAG: PAS domain S-box protein [Actinobacteria bacterium]|nr:PAS domain S-box protein [Actinomycetota bacterium]